MVTIIVAFIDAKYGNGHSLMFVGSIVIDVAFLTVCDIWRNK
jgi:hypothetical protein